MVQIPWEWRVSQVGAEDVKAKFEDLRQSYASGAISQDQYRKGVRDLKKDLNDLKDTARINKSAFEAAHPALINFGRAASAMSSVMRGINSGINTVNIAMLSFSSTNTTLAEAQNSADKAQRAYNDAVAKFGKDSPQAKDALGDWNVEQAKLKKTLEDSKQEDINKLFAISTGIAEIGTNAALAGPKLAPFVGTLGPLAGILAGITGGFLIEPAITNPGKNPIDVQNERTQKALQNMKNIFDTEFAAIKFTFDNFWTINMLTYQKWVGDMNKTTMQVMNSIGKFFSDGWAGISTILSLAWLGIQKGFTQFWNGFATIANQAMKGIASGINGFINSIIGGVEVALNALSRLTGGGGVTLPRVNISAPAIPMISAATGFSGQLRSDTLFQAHKGEMVNISPASSQVSNSVSTTTNSSNAATIINNTIVQGSVIRERDLYQTNSRYQKREILRRGFRPV